MTGISGHGAGDGSAAAPVDGQLLELRAIGKSFGPVQALAGIDLDVPAGQVTALVLLAAVAVDALTRRGQNTR